MAIGCTHGYHVDRNQFEFVLRFKEKFKPDTRVHLGDIWDLPSLRTGAAGTSDETKPIRGDGDSEDDDIQMGFDLLDEYEATDATLGNHDLKRVEKFLTARQAYIREAAHSLRKEIIAGLNKRRIRWIPWDVEHSLVFGDTHFNHGFSFGLSSLRTRSLSWPKHVGAHDHVAGQYTGPGFTGTKVISVGTWIDLSKAEYAKERHNTLAWSRGIVWGEYCSKYAQLNLWQHNPRSGQEMRLPF